MHIFTSANVLICCLRHPDVWRWASVPPRSRPGAGGGPPEALTGFKRRAWVESVPEWAGPPMQSTLLHFSVDPEFGSYLEE